MNETVARSIEILLQGYPTTFLVILSFYIMIKLLMKTGGNNKDKK